MNRIVTVKVKKSRFGKCTLVFSGPAKGSDDTNVYVTCDKDPGVTIRVWYFPPTRQWACEIQRPNGYTSFGTQMLDGTYGWRTNKAAWEFAAKRCWGNT